MAEPEYKLTPSSSFLTPGSAREVPLKIQNELFPKVPGGVPPDTQTLPLLRVREVTVSSYPESSRIHLHFESDGPSGQLRWAYRDTRHFVVPVVTQSSCSDTRIGARFSYSFYALVCYLVKSHP